MLDNSNKQNKEKCWNETINFQLLYPKIGRDATWKQAHVLLHVFLIIYILIFCIFFTFPQFNAIPFYWLNKIELTCEPNFIIMYNKMIKQTINAFVDSKSIDDRIAGRYPDIERIQTMLRTERKKWTLKRMKK